MTFKTGDFVRRKRGSRAEAFIIRPGPITFSGRLTMHVYCVSRQGVGDWLLENLELCPYGPMDQEVAAFTTHMLTEE